MGSKPVRQQPSLRWRRAAVRPLLQSCPLFPGPLSQRCPLVAARVLLSMRGGFPLCLMDASNIPPHHWGGSPPIPPLSPIRSLSPPIPPLSAASQKWTPLRKWLFLNKIPPGIRRRKKLQEEVRERGKEGETERARERASERERERERGREGERGRER